MDTFHTVKMIKRQQFGHHCKVKESIFISAQKMKLSIKDIFSKCDQIRSFLWIWSHLLKKSLIVNFIFCAVNSVSQMAVFTKYW